MTNCGDISKSLVLAACGSSSAGIEAEIIIGNHADIDKVESQIDGNICSELMLSAESKGAYKYSSHRNAFEGDCTLAKGTYQNSFDHKIVLRIFAKTQEAKDELNKLKQGKVFVITKGIDANNPQTRRELYGFDNGLVLNDFQAPTTDADGVIYTLTLGSDDKAKESQLPLSIWATSEAATETMIKGLVKAVEAV